MQKEEHDSTQVVYLKSHNSYLLPYVHIQAEFTLNFTLSLLTIKILTKFSP